MVEGMGAVFVELADCMGTGLVELVVVGSLSLRIEIEIEKRSSRLLLMDQLCKLFLGRRVVFYRIDTIKPIPQ